MPDIVAARPIAGAPVETGWGDQVHDALEGVQSGTLSLVGITNVTGVLATVTFPRAYTAPPIISLAAQSNVVALAINNLTATSFGFAARRADGSGTATTQTVFWTAIGTVA